MKVSLIISTYNWPEALKLCLKTILHQTQYPHEIIIADDGSTVETANMIKNLQTDYPIPIKHIWHEDKGFRKTIIMNKAIKAATGDYIIQIDGDILVHPCFIEDHVSAAAPGFFARGGRTLINALKTKFFLRRIALHPQKSNLTRSNNKFNAFRIPFLSKAFSKTSDDVMHVKGCNLAYWKSDFVAINGYNNDINGWGHEDIELVIRLHNSGIKMKKIKFKAIAFHLHHTFNSRNCEKKNMDMTKQALYSKLTRVENGYDNV
ncbi:MAG: glycosyltransferase family 2 protein [Bacteroides sp.]